MASIHFQREISIYGRYQRALFSDISEFLVYGLLVIPRIKSERVQLYARQGRLWKIKTASPAKQKPAKWKRRSSTTHYSVIDQRENPVPRMKTMRGSLLNNKPPPYTESTSNAPEDRKAKQPWRETHQKIHTIQNTPTQAKTPIGNRIKTQLNVSF